jgi:hypothetical protein
MKMQFLTILLSLPAFFAGVFAADESGDERGACNKDREGETACSELFPSLPPSFPSYFFTLCTDVFTEIPAQANILWFTRDSVVVCHNGKWDLVEKCSRQGYCKFTPHSCYMMSWRIRRC